jgi:hypothetical protein
MIGASPEQGSGPSTVPSLSPSDALISGLHMQRLDSRNPIPLFIVPSCMSNKIQP